MASKLSVEQIKVLQRKLNAAGLWDGDDKPLRVDGSLGEKTRAAMERALKAAPNVTTRSSRALVSAVQSALRASGITDRDGKELAVDGRLGELTRSAIQKLAPKQGLMSRPGLGQMVNPINRGAGLSRIPEGAIRQRVNLGGQAGRDIQPNAEGSLVSDSLQWDQRIHGADPLMAAAMAGQDQQPTAGGEFIPQSLGYDSRMHGPDPFMAGGSASTGQPVSASAQASGPVNMTFPEGSEIEAHPLDRIRIAAARDPQISPEIAQAAMAKASLLAAMQRKNAWWNKPKSVGEGFVTPFGDRSPELASMKAPLSGVDELLARLSQQGGLQ